MQLMYTETPCFGENKRIQQITPNTRKYMFWTRYKSYDLKISRLTPKKIQNALRFFLRESGKKMMRIFNHFCQKRWSRGWSF